MQNQIVWVDIPVVDLERAITFYAAVLNGPVTKQKENDFEFAVLPHAGSSVSGCLFKTHGDAPSLNGPLVYLNADGRLKDALEIAKKKGGKVLQEIQSIGQHGFRAVIVDSEGNRIALHSMTN